jgi:hypothetical protein
MRATISTGTQSLIFPFVCLSLGQVSKEEGHRP